MRNLSWDKCFNGFNGDFNELCNEIVICIWCETRKSNQITSDNPKAMQDDSNKYTHTNTLKSQNRWKEKNSVNISLK